MFTLIIVAHLFNASVRDAGWGTESSTVVIQPHQAFDSFELCEVARTHMSQSMVARHFFIASQGCYQTSVAKK